MIAKNAMGDLGRDTHSTMSTTKFSALTATPKIMSATIRLAGLARARDLFSANIRTPKQATAIRLSEKSIKICRGIAMAHSNAKIPFLTTGWRMSMRLIACEKTRLCKQSASSPYVVSAKDDRLFEDG